MLRPTYPLSELLGLPRNTCCAFQKEVMAGGRHNCVAEKTDKRAGLSGHCLDHQSVSLVINPFTADPVTALHFVILV